MKVGDKIKFDFAGKKKQGLVHKTYPNMVYLKVDFEKDKGKIVKRKRNILVPPKNEKPADKKSTKK